MNIGKPARSTSQSKGTARPEALGRTHRKAPVVTDDVERDQGPDPWGLEGRYKAFGFYYC